MITAANSLQPPRGVINAATLANTDGNSKKPVHTAIYGFERKKRQGWYGMSITAAAVVARRRRKSKQLVQAIFRSVDVDDILVLYCAVVERHRPKRLCRLA